MEPTTTEPEHVLDLTHKRPTPYPDQTIVQSLLQQQTPVRLTSENLRRNPNNRTTTSITVHAPSAGVSAAAVLVICCVTLLCYCLLVQICHTCRCCGRRGNATRECDIASQCAAHRALVQQQTPHHVHHSSGDANFGFHSNPHHHQPTSDSAEAARETETEVKRRYHYHPTRPPRRKELNFNSLSKHQEHEENAEKVRNWAHSVHEHVYSDPRLQRPAYEGQEMEDPRSPMPQRRTPIPPPPNRPLPPTPNDSTEGSQQEPIYEEIDETARPGHEYDEPDRTDETNEQADDDEDGERGSGNTEEASLMDHFKSLTRNT